MRRRRRTVTPKWSTSNTQETLHTLVTHDTRGGHNRGLWSAWLGSHCKQVHAREWQPPVRRLPSMKPRVRKPPPCNFTPPTNVEATTPQRTMPFGNNCDAHVPNLEKKNKETRTREIFFFEHPNEEGVHTPDCADVFCHRKTLVLRCPKPKELSDSPQPHVCQRWVCWVQGDSS